MGVIMTSFFLDGTLGEQYQVLFKFSQPLGLNTSLRSVWYDQLLLDMVKALWPSPAGIGSVVHAELQGGSPRPCSSLKQSSTPGPKCEYLGFPRRGLQSTSLRQEWRQFQAEASTSCVTPFIVTLHIDHYSTSQGHRTAAISLISLLLRRFGMTIWSAMMQI